MYNTTRQSTYRVAGYGRRQHNDHDQECAKVGQDWYPVSPGKRNHLASWAWLFKKVRIKI